VGVVIVGYGNASGKDFWIVKTHWGSHGVNKVTSELFAARVLVVLTQWLAVLLHK